MAKLEQKIIELLKPKRSMPISNLIHEIHKITGVEKNKVETRINKLLKQGKLNLKNKTISILNETELFTCKKCGRHVSIETMNKVKDTCPYCKQKTSFFDAIEKFGEFESDFQEFVMEELLKEKTDYTDPLENYDDKIQESLDWHDSAAKYYFSYRVLIYLGFTKQAYNMLCFCIEKLLKIHIKLKTNSFDYTHNLKLLFSKSKLNKKDYSLIEDLCNNLVYNDLRYEFDITSNKITLLHEDLDKEFSNLSLEIIKLINKSYNTNICYGHWDSLKQVFLRQDKKYKHTFLKRALESYDKIQRFDFT